uniref:Uncharacterized protein n=1 Tax=Megaselia scalaris TaxID=36166 RepID=T1GDY0_MEGSC
MLEFMGDRNVNRQRKGFSTTISCCKKKNGDLVTNKEEVFMRWKDFFRELLNSNESRKSSQRNQYRKFQKNEDVPPSTRAEVDKAKTLKNSRGGGHNGFEIGAPREGYEDNVKVVKLGKMKKRCFEKQKFMELEFTRDNNEERKFLHPR